MKLIEESSVLCDVAKTGKKKYWKKQILVDGDQVFTRSIFWLEGSVEQPAALKQIEGKNLGRANETSPLAQARKEFEAEIRLKRDKGYRNIGEEKVELTKPMLAHDFRKHYAKLPEEVYLDLKIDGVRCLWNGERAWSRLGKEFGEHIVDLLRRFEAPGTVDGELIIPKATFESTVSAVKKESSLTKYLTFRVYDVIVPGTMREREEILSQLDWGDSIQKLNRELVLLKDVPAMGEEARARGEEGVIVRNPESHYEVGTRSYGLQKFKGWVGESEEFKIVDVKEGSGREKGRAIFTVERKGKPFDVRPRGTMEERSRWWNDREALIGKELTVEYQNLTAEGIPRFPVGIEIRDYE